MYLRPAAGIGILLAVFLILPVSALLPAIDPGVVTVSQHKTGTVFVTLRDINGTAGPENVAFAYVSGDVRALPSWSVAENPDTALVTVALKNGTRTRIITFDPATAPANAYAINTITVAGESEPLYLNNKAFSGSPSASSYYMDVVPEGRQHEWIDLDWKDPSKDLSLSVYAPDAILGPYADNADGRKDGRIFLDIASRLNVTAGPWFFKVNNANSDPADYALNTYSA